MDWSEVRARLEEDAFVAGEADGALAESYAADIRAALAEIERRGERLAKWEQEEVTRAVKCCGQEERAEAAEAKLAEEYEARARVENENGKLQEYVKNAGAEIERLRLDLTEAQAQLRDERRFCLCGCLVEHHTASEDGLECDEHRDFECVLVCAPAKVLWDQREAERERLREALEKITVEAESLTRPDIADSGRWVWVVGIARTALRGQR